MVIGSGSRLCAFGCASEEGRGKRAGARKGHARPMRKAMVEREKGRRLPCEMGVTEHVARLNMFGRVSDEGGLSICEAWGIDRCVSEDCFVDMKLRAYARGKETATANTLATILVRHDQPTLPPSPSPLVSESRRV